MSDLLMLRGEQIDGFNLAPGEPVMLQSSAIWCRPGFEYWFLPDPKYPAYGGDHKLIELVRKQLKYVKKHVVITNGAKQALLAAMYAYKTNPKNFRTEVEHLAPFWPSYPTLAKLSGMSFTQLRENGKSFGWQKQLKIITSPNNPDGSQSAEKCDVWDGAYAHWMYGCKIIPQHETGIFSAAKLLGLSGSRVGVLTTDNDEVAERAREYIEKTTSGVSVDGQERVIAALEFIEREPEQAKVAYAEARGKLVKNGQIFGELMGQFCLEIQGVPVTKTGMFVWFKAQKSKMDKALDAAKIKIVPGTACGVVTDPRDDLEWYRMSMGQENDYTTRALVRLRAELI